MDKISQHITFAEATKSQTAVRLGIKNTPNTEQLVCMVHLANSIFEPIRAHFGKPIGISSFFRNADLNKAIKGAKGSQHEKGEAMDIDADIFGGLKNSEIFNYIKNNLSFDQLIWEFGTAYEPDWVHVSTKKTGNRKQILRAVKIGGKTEYRPFDL